MVIRTYEQERALIVKDGINRYRIDPGFVENMTVPAYVYVNKQLERLLFDELANYIRSTGRTAQSGFLPAVKQIANVASLPGIVGKSIGLPDVHAGYGFAIGNVAAFDMANPDSIVSPGGVGFDINCGVRLVRTNLTLNDIKDVKESLAQAVFNYIPVGVGSQGMIPCRPQGENLSGRRYFGRSGRSATAGLRLVSEGRIFMGGR